MRASCGRSLNVGLGLAVAMLAVPARGWATEPVEDSPVVGRYAVDSEAGGAVWAFQPSGQLVVLGPGELVAEGAWTEGPANGEFDGSLRIEVTAQDLEILGAVSPDGRQMALYVRAGEAAAPGDWDPWPAESRLLGTRLQMSPDEAPPPSPAASDCLRPAWGLDDVIDWDRCEGPEVPAIPQGSPGAQGARGASDAERTASPQASPGASASPSPQASPGVIASPSPGA
jgi:hypothetical protein